jgi:hypothetical protein
MHIIARGKDEIEAWKRTSMITYHVGRFGNSDPKKFPSTIKKYMPELWADLEENDVDNDPLIMAARARQAKNN